MVDRGDQSPVVAAETVRRVDARAARPRQLQRGPARAAADRGPAIQQGGHQQQHRGAPEQKAESLPTSERREDR